MKVGIYTLGCKVNLYESEYVISLFQKQGYTICPFDDYCDIYIINTCTVTNTSDLKSQKIIRQAIKRNPQACVVAMGCFIEANQELDIPGVDIYIGTKNKSKVVEYVEEYYSNKKELRETSPELASGFENMEIETFPGRTRAFVKIQDGCENFCSYCIIPFVRGKCRSKDFHTVIEEISKLIKNGYKEIVLTGIHTGNYGVDINTSFGELLEAITSLEGLTRLRISSIEITELNSKVLESLKNRPMIANHLHIPLQAGSKEILTAMNRKYDKDYFLNKVKEIRLIRPDISLSTDVIVGFPGETEEDFEESLAFIRQIAFSKVHVFPYSKRTGTVAADMDNQVDDISKKVRVKKLLALSKKLEIDYMNKFINKQADVLIEKVLDDSSIGHTSNYLLVKVNQVLARDKVESVTITDVDYPYCIGTVN
ncbi:MAG: tRNA (N(6)-L-threonylcarbamoyladenosine(37)-C(2))-methylthiotransferase MtaB [Bacilli bacterium]